MALDKAIEHGHDHRKPYRGSKAFDKTCRNHGSCGWCKDDREHKNKKRQAATDARLEDYMCENQMTIEDWIRDATLY